MIVAGWRGAALVVIALAGLALLFVLALWAAIAMGVVGGLVWLNLVLLPRLSRRLHLPPVALELICLPLLGGAGWLLSGATGAGVGTLAWLAGIGLPRLAGRRLRSRLRTSARRPGTLIVVEAPALGGSSRGASKTNPVGSPT